MRGNGFGTGMGVVWVFWLLLLAGIVLVVVVVVRMIGGGVRSDGRDRAGRGSAGGSGAVDVLNERYARGEITTEEYRERLAVLRGDG